MHVWFTLWLAELNFHLSIFFSMESVLILLAFSLLSDLNNLSLPPSNDVQETNLIVQIRLLWQILIYSLPVTVTSHYSHSYPHSPSKPKYYFLQQPCWRDFLEPRLPMLLLHHHNPCLYNSHPFSPLDKQNTICSSYKLHDPANNYIPQFMAMLKDKANNRSQYWSFLHS